MYLFNFVMQAEIEKVKKRREERAVEKAQHEEEMVSRPVIKQNIISKICCASKIKLC